MLILRMVLMRLLRLVYQCLVLACWWIITRNRLFMERHETILSVFLYSLLFILFMFWYVHHTLLLVVMRYFLFVHGLAYQTEILNPTKRIIDHDLMLFYCLMMLIYFSPHWWLDIPCSIGLSTVNYLTIVLLSSLSITGCITVLLANSHRTGLFRMMRLSLWSLNSCTGIDTAWATRWLSWMTVTWYCISLHAQVL